MFYQWQIFTNSLKFLQLLLLGNIEEKQSENNYLICFYVFISLNNCNNKKKCLQCTDIHWYKTSINWFIGSKDFQWEFVHGLFENAIYGGRVDNYFDMRILRSYLEQLFNSRIIGSLNARGRKMTSFPHLMSLPNSCSILVGINLL